MAEGAILPIASIALSVIGGFTQAGAQAGQAKAEKQAAEYNAQVARNNATAATQQADYNAGRTREQALRSMGSQRAAYAKSGVDISGTALDVGLDSAVSVELDALAQQYQGKLATNRYLQEARLHDYEANLLSPRTKVNVPMTLLTSLASQSGNIASAYGAMGGGKPASIKALPAGPGF